MASFILHGCLHHINGSSSFNRLRFFNRFSHGLCLFRISQQSSHRFCILTLQPLKLWQSSALAAFAATDSCFFFAAFLLLPLLFLLSGSFCCFCCCFELHFCFLSSDAWHFSSKSSAPLHFCFCSAATFLPPWQQPPSAALRFARFCPIRIFCSRLVLHPFIRGRFTTSA